MPILIVLKDPRVNLVAEGKIDDAHIKQWDEIFQNQILMFKSQTGNMTVVPLLQDCNIAVMEEITEEELAKQKKEAEERRKKAEAQGGPGGGGGGSSIFKPSFGFPSGRRGRG